MTPQQQVLQKCKDVVAIAKEKYGIDMSAVRISFALKGRAAGKASGLKWMDTVISNYTVKFNLDMMSRDAFDHILNDTVPHEYAHILCFINPVHGKNHDYGWEKVCVALGGNGARLHKEAVVYGKGSTYEYISRNGKPIRMSQQRHARVQQGGTMSYRNGIGIVDKSCAYSIVGHQGMTLCEPIVMSSNRTITVAPVIQPVLPKSAAPVFNAGTSKASIARTAMLQGHKEGKGYEDIIAAVMHATGLDRQLARSYYKGNYAKVGVPAP